MTAESSLKSFMPSFWIAGWFVKLATLEILETDDRLTLGVSSLTVPTSSDDHRCTASWNAMRGFSSGVSSISSPCTSRTVRYS